MRTIRLVRIFFDNIIAPREVPLFRGAVNVMLAGQHSILFHNHLDDGFRYAYPLIQYKRIGNRAAIVALEDGTAALTDFFSADTRVVRIGQAITHRYISDIKAEEFSLQMQPTMQRYRLRNWLPLNAANYAAYRATESLVERIAFMERVLTGNILSFLKGIGIFVEEQLVCTITDIGAPRPIRYKGVKLMSFDVDFRANIALPPLIGLGKGASTGFGTITVNNM